MIPHRETETAKTTLKSLPKGIKTVVIGDKGKGANWARNQGFKQVDTEFVLFSDNDLRWRDNAISELLIALEETPEASYSYGAYEMGGQIYCNQGFDADMLKKWNYICTMSLIRTKDFLGFDESVKRFQDWDLWLTMLEQGKIGVHCGEILFDTDVREGLTFNSDDPIMMEQIIKDKHKI